jgi:hypothetical protein
LTGCIAKAQICIVTPFLFSFSHGFIQTVTVAGQSYPGWDPNLDPYTATPTTRVIRKIPDDGPVTDTTSADLSCNQLGEAGQPISADAAPGDNVVWKWNQWLEDHHGPVWTHMAKCNGPCADYDLSLDKGGKDLKWFKIDAQGYDPSTKTWASDDLRAGACRECPIFRNDSCLPLYLIDAMLAQPATHGRPRFQRTLPRANI